MRNKRRHKRSIIVDGVPYTWKYGDCVEIRQGRSVILRRPVTEILGITWDELERSRRKGSGYPLTPMRVAALIREVHGRTSSSQNADASCSRCGRPEAPGCCATCVLKGAS